MTIEIIALAAASMVRPTSLAAMYALLGHDSRRPFMVAYVLGGMAFTVAFGLVVVYVLHGIHLAPGKGRAQGIAGGVAALGFGFAVLLGHVHGPDAQDAPRSEGRLATMLHEHVTTRIAVLAGPATHLPGIFYLIALNVIVARNLRVRGSSLDVVTYNVIWFALPILALVLCITRPDAARDAIGAVNRWATDHSRVLLLSVSFVVGAALVVRGALKL